MPNSELHRLAKGALESTQTRMTNYSADLAFPPANEFLELVCENGQILMQGQSSRNRKNLSCTGFSSPTSKAQEKDGGDAVTPKIGRFGNMDAVLNDFPSSPGTSGHMGLGQDDDIVPWLNYPLDETLQHDYCSDFFSELTGVNLNVLSSQNNVVPFDKNSSYGQMVRDSHLASVHAVANPHQRNMSNKVNEGGPDPTRPRSSQLYPPPLKECQTSIPSLRPRVSDFISCNSNNAHQAPCRNSNQTPAGTQPNTKMRKQDQGSTRPPPQPSNNAGLMNFSHFSRPAALVKANLQSISGSPSPGSSSLDRLRCNDKISAVSSNPMESTLIDMTSGSRSVTGFQNPPVPMAGKVDIELSTSRPSKELLSTEQSGAICRDDASRITRLPDPVLRQTSSFAASTTIRRPDTEKNVDSLVASSSMCSGNSAGGASNDLKHNLKRKSREADESEYQSEDVEEESVGGRKPANTRGGPGAKRSRAAEVHNLSERRRRDRINEKMRALQELIPNCNKVDKASMLDEAIEYLKTLQLQVQIMSMGTGLYMPPMMLPTGMQRIPGQHMLHFPPMGVGMGMGMGMGMGVGFGMGMLDMSSGSSMMQMPPMHSVQFPCPPLSRPNSFPPMPGPSLQMFGIPGQGLPMSMPRAPYVPPSEGPFTKSVPLPDVSGTATPVEIPGSASSPSSKDPIQKMNSQMMHNTNAECSQNKTSKATREGFEKSPTAQRNDQTPHVVATETSTLPTEMGL